MHEENDLLDEDFDLEDAERMSKYFGDGLIPVIRGSGMDLFVQLQSLRVRRYFGRRAIIDNSLKNMQVFIDESFVTKDICPLKLIYKKDSICNHRLGRKLIACNDAECPYNRKYNEVRPARELFNKWMRQQRKYEWIRIQVEQ